MTTKNLKRIATLGTLGLAVLLAACSSKPSDSEYTDAVKTGLARQALCWNPPGTNGAFPSHLTNAQYDPANEAKKAAIRAGVIAIVEQNMAYTVTLTPKGEAAHVWDPKTGLCVGQKELVGEVKILAGGDRGDDSDMKTVSYSWQLTNVPGWVKDSAMASQGLQELGLGHPVKMESVITREKKDGPLILEEN